MYDIITATCMPSHLKLDFYAGYNLLSVIKYLETLKGDLSIA